MIPLALKLEFHRRQQLARSDLALRQAIVLLWQRPALDHVEEPDGLEYPMDQRSRRLMRNARVCGS